MFRISFALLMAFGVTACKDAAKEAETTEAQEVVEAAPTAVSYRVDTEKTVIHWEGFKPTESHTGTIAVSEGKVSVLDSNVEAGKFTIDMKSIQNTDMKGNGKANLEAHLMGTVEGKEGHFFNVNKFPTGSFEMTGVSEVEGKTMVEGNLTLKDKTNNISFPATITVTDTEVKIDSEPFSIDRTLWDVNYGSKTIFEDLGDKFIDDNIQLTINLVATK